MTVPFAVIMMDLHLYTGGYNEKNGGGICHFRFSADTGETEIHGVETACRNPSFLAFHPGGGVLYAANEVEDTACITAHRVQADGSLQYMGAVHTDGAGMCHLYVNRAGTAVYGADYGSGNVVAFRLCQDGGFGSMLSNISHPGGGTHPWQDRARMHQVVPDPDEKRLIAVDFGVNALFAYELEASGALRPETCVKSMLPPGEGPRHLVFHPDGGQAYVITELGNRIYQMAYDRTSGSFSVLDRVSLMPQGAGPSVTSAEIAFSPDKRFLFASVRGADKIVVLKVEEGTGTLLRHTEFSCGGREPRMFSFDSEGRHLFVANQQSGTVCVFELNPSNGNFVRECGRLSVPEVSFAALGFQTGS